MADTEIREPFYEVVDVWPPGTLTEGCMMAYKLMAKRGEITMQKVIHGKYSGVTTICYLSMEPFESRRRKQMRQAKHDALMLDDSKWVQARMG